MTIDPDVAVTARHFGLDPRLLQAVVQAEGNILRAVQCSQPSVESRQQALDITCRSLVHRMTDFIHAHGGLAFVDYFAEKWAPPNAANDPNHLNANFAKNVSQLWLGTT